MGFMDEIKKLTHPYSDVEEDDYDDYDDEPLDNTPPAAPRPPRKPQSEGQNGSGEQKMRPRHRGGRRRGGSGGNKPTSGSEV